MSAANRLSHALHRWSLRRRQYGGGAPVLEALYTRVDPWNLANRDDQHRFTMTNAALVSMGAPVDSLLEIGCGEGAQTRHFLHLAAHVTGIDVSATALARARLAVPGAVFLHVKLSPSTLPIARYDVATLCEVLYYSEDPARLLREAQRCAGRVLVTNYEARAQRLEPLFGGEGWQQLAPIKSGRKRWRAYCWTATAENS